MLFLIHNYSTVSVFFITQSHNQAVHEYHKVHNSPCKHGNIIMLVFENIETGYNINPSPTIACAKIRVLWALLRLRLIIQNFIVWQLYAQKCRKYRKIQYCGYRAPLPPTPPQHPLLLHSIPYSLLIGVQNITLDITKNPHRICEKDIESYCNQLSFYIDRGCGQRVGEEAWGGGVTMGGI